jgi:Flp pilus assembly protein TadB
MLTACLIAGALLGVFPFLAVILMILVWEQPLVAALIMIGVAGSGRWRRPRRPRQDHVADFLRTWASELRAGRSLRAGLVESARANERLGLSRVERLAAAGRPLAEVGAALAVVRGLAPAAAALAVASHTGGSAVAVFDALAADAVDEASFDRERRELTATARFSVAIVGGFPLVVFAYQLANGQAARLVRSGPIGIGIIGLGSLLLVAGLGTVAGLLRRARR